MKIFLITLFLICIACTGGYVQQFTNYIVKIPTVSRADTRLFIGMRFADTIPISITMNRILDALPNETALCLYGYSQDTTFIESDFLNPLDSSRVDRKIAIVDSVWPANIEQSGPHFLIYTDRIACLPHLRLIGVVHSHPLSIKGCDHSDFDALFTHSKEEKYWFSLVFCPHNNNLLWADGRRITFKLKRVERNSNSGDGRVDNSSSNHYINILERMSIFERITIK